VGGCARSGNGDGAEDRPRPPRPHLRGRLPPSARSSGRSPPSPCGEHPNVTGERRPPGQPLAGWQRGRLVSCRDRSKSRSWILFLRTGPT